MFLGDFNSRDGLSLTSMGPLEIFVYNSNVGLESCLKMGLIRMIF